MRILIVVSEAPPIVSGISRCIERLTVGLRSRGHTVDVISAVEVPRLTLGEFRFSSFALHWPKIVRMLPQYDVVNVHGPIPTMSDVFLLLSRALPRTIRPRVVYTHHSAIDIENLGPACAAYNRAHKMLARAAHRVVVTSRSYYDLMQASGGPPVEIVPWGVDVPVPAPPARSPAADGRLRVLFVGQMRPYKGVDTLLRSVAGEPRLELTLVGSGAMIEHYRALAASLGATNAHFVGGVSDEELANQYSSHDVIALPSTTRAEAFGLVLLEGMARGCVAVASDLPGVREVASRAGLVVPPRDHLALRRTLLFLAADVDRLAELQQRARQAAVDMTWDRTILRYEQAFEKTVALWHATDAVTALPAAMREGRSTLDDLVHEFEASWGSILLFRRQPMLQVWAAWGRAGLPQLRTQPPRIASHVALTGRARCLDDSVDDVLVQPLLLRKDVRSAMVAPFETRRGMVGVVNLSRSVSQEFTYTNADLERLVRRLPTVPNTHVHARSRAAALAATFVGL